jgi:hypothetical protein
VNVGSRSDPFWVGPSSPGSLRPPCETRQRSPAGGACLLVIAGPRDRIPPRGFPQFATELPNNGGWCCRPASSERIPWLDRLRLRGSGILARLPPRRARRPSPSLRKSGAMRSAWTRSGLPTATRPSAGIRGAHLRRDRADLRDRDPDGGPVTVVRCGSVNQQNRRAMAAAKVPNRGAVFGLNAVHARSRTMGIIDAAVQPQVRKRAVKRADPGMGGMCPGPPHFPNTVAFQH